MALRPRALRYFWENRSGRSSMLGSMECAEAQREGYSGPLEYSIIRTDGVDKKRQLQALDCNPRLRQLGSVL
jgi:hypothetical protein